jgi:VanZ family protein
MSVLHPFARPRLWQGLWWVGIVAVFVVCLLPAPDLPQLPEGGDKVEHFLAYFLLAGAAAQLHAQRVTLWRPALGLLLMGILIEILQGMLTTTRSADVADALADAAGVVAGLALAWTPVRGWLLALDRKLFR